MNIHDWSRVPVGVFHDFHHEWISELKRAINRILPSGFYALAEQKAAGYGPDVLALERTESDDVSSTRDANGGGNTAVLTAPTTSLVMETCFERKSSRIGVRLVSGDRLVAIVEVVSPGNKSSEVAVDQFVDKAVEFLTRGVHFLLLDVHPAGKRDRDGLHGEIWRALDSDPLYTAPAGRPLTFASYESTDILRAYVEPLAINLPLPKMPLFLQPGMHVEVPTASTYGRAFAEVPQRFQAALDEK